MSDRQVAVVTGGGRGIGAAIVRHLAKDGYQVVVIDRTEPEKELECAFVQADVTSWPEVQRAFSQIEETVGAVELLCNNAGVSSMQRVIDLSVEDWDHNFDVNAKGVFLCTKACLSAMMARRRGVIVNTASMAGLRGVPLLAHYAASKWAVIGFTKSVAIEAAAFGIRVNAVCPGYVKTSMQERELLWEAKLRQMTPQAVADEYVRMTPLGRIEEPEDVADVVSFLASPAARFMTGEAVAVTGGADLL